MMALLVLRKSMAAGSYVEILLVLLVYVRLCVRVCALLRTQESTYDVKTKMPIAHFAHACVTVCALCVCALRSVHCGDEAKDARRGSGCQCRPFLWVSRFMYASFTSASVRHPVLHNLDFCSLVLCDP